MKIYNTLSRKKEDLNPINKSRIGMYVCGPTVYGPGHIGHARTYISFDIIRKYLEYKNYKVKFIMNITDIHDDIIKEAKRLKTPFLNLGDKYAKLFLEELKVLGIKEASYYPKVTRHIEEIIRFVQKLIKKGFAYEKQGSVYFDISKLKNYGKLSGVKTKKGLTGTRVETDKYEKKEIADFVLWKAVPPQDPAGWKSPWGKGRPGWHIECSVMSQKYLGEMFDIHGGAKDLIFPHHENEIAQSESLILKSPFVKYWMHSGLLTIRGQKMSKSLKNYITIKEALNSWQIRTLRLFVLMSHYQSPQDFNEKTLGQAKKGIERIDEFLDKLREIKNRKDNKKRGREKKESVKKLISKTQKEFETAMDDDFNTPIALASLFYLISRGNYFLDNNMISPPDAGNILRFFEKIDKVFSFIFLEKPKKDNVQKEISELIIKREKYRKQENWKAADEIRKKIENLGYQIKDTNKGPKIKKTGA